jgi:chromosome segregation ATPase
MVNRGLFRFSHSEAYDDLIKLLLNVRSPKLSKEFKPSVICEILHNALAPLSQDELRPLADTIDYINQAREQLTQLKQDRTAMLGIRRAYGQYNRHLVIEKAQNFMRMHKVAGEKQETLEDARSLAAQQKKQLVTLGLQLKEQKQEQEETERFHMDWLDHDVFKAEARRNQLNKDLRQHESRLGKQQQELQRKQQQLQQNEARVIQEARRNEDQHGAITASLEQLDELGQAAHFSDHVTEAESFRKRLKSIQIKPSIRISGAIMPVNTTRS